MEAAKERPPYITFEMRPIEDRDATLLAGHWVAKDVLFAIITPQGSKDKVEQVADEWFAKLEEAVREGRFPSEWLRAYRSIRKDFEEGREIPLEGTPVLTWPAVSPAQVQTLLAANIRTVEDLAALNESAMNSLGAGSRALQQRAVQWLEAAKNGIPAEKHAALLAENEQLKTQVDNQQKKLEELAASVAALQKAAK